MSATPDRTGRPDERPPLFGSWNRLYAAVLAYLVILILIFHFFSTLYS